MSDDARPGAANDARSMPAGSPRRADLENRRAQPIGGTRPAAPADEAVPCDRCGTAMFRMHAVWRCPECGYKTDCCGW